MIVSDFTMAIAKLSALEVLVPHIDFCLQEEFITLINSYNANTHISISYAFIHSFKTI